MKMTKKEKITIKDFWWFHNVDCWKIKRQGFVDFYLYIPTMRYVFKSKCSGKWIGTKYPHSLLMLTEKKKNKKLKKRKHFKNEKQAVKWLAGE